MIKKKPKKKPAKSAAKQTVARARAKSAAATVKARSAPAAKAEAKSQPKPKAKATTRQAAPLVEGAQAPDFHLQRDGGKTVSLADFAGEKLVIYFYPRADTPGCTREAIDFSRLAGDFAGHGTKVIGVSADAVKAQDAFRDKYKLGVPLVSDETKGMIKAYGAWGEKSMYGRTFEGILRTTVLIGGDGLVLRVWRNVRVDGHAEDVLAAAQAAA
jgi:peroxiredoxin Q/BCP